MDRLMNVLTGFSLLLIAQVLMSVRREHIRVEYSVSWLVAAVILLIVSLNRPLVESLAAVLGVEHPPVAILMIVLCVFLVVFYRFSIRISALKDANIALAQRLAILEYQVKSLEHEQQETANR
ncbi:MAG TPA: DUF2304 domain-containing protein [Bryobacteraceae bacterium]|nr:DUF2304 domain-containing protein [Bryobacteraceae bacterium]